ncbi:MAG: hypothetical protein AAF378_25115 [Cyanobacteria bacterium P01_A01_bin.84]
MINLFSLDAPGFKTVTPVKVLDVSNPGVTSRITLQAFEVWRSQLLQKTMVENI